MFVNFTKIDYLQTGNLRQQAAFGTLQQVKVFEVLKAYFPILTGTIPIEIDIKNSDMDVICCVENHAAFADTLKENFQDYPNFSLWNYRYKNLETTVASFYAAPFEIEIFGQNIPTEKQNAYLHMLIEHAVLQEKGETFRQQVLQLKQSGIKTEPAFAQLLNLTGDPFEALLEYGKIHFGIG